jgi:nicotinate-nucleotide adenylyltransferase
MTVLLGGAFDPPHNGHVALVEEASRRFGEPVVVLVNADPGHKQVASPPEARLELARLAFPGAAGVQLDPFPRTIDLLEAHRYEDPVFVVGADEFARFLEIWVRPQDVLELTRLAVATRPGYPRERLDAVLDRLDRPDRVEFFELEPVPVSSSEIREKVARSEPIEGLVPPAVAEAVARLGLYRSPGYTDGATSEET